MENKTREFLDLSFLIGGPYQLDVTLIFIASVSTTPFSVDEREKEDIVSDAAKV